MTWQAKSSYAKSADTRDAILQAAITAFGEAGFKAVTTRQIAQAAGVNQPAIAYYFKNKEGLYLACAQDIVKRYTGRATAPSLEAIKALDAGLTPDAARRHLKDVMAALADVILARDEDRTATGGFVEREMRDPGLAYQFIYDNFWGPGVDLVARLIAAAKGQAKSGESVADVERAQAIMLITSLLAFTPGPSISLQAMGWDELGDKEAALVRQTLNAQIDAVTKG